MIDASGLKNFIKNSVLQYMENEMDFSEVIKEAIRNSSSSTGESASIEDVVDDIAAEVRQATSSALLSNKQISLDEFVNSIEDIVKDAAPSEGTENSSEFSADDIAEEINNEIIENTDFEAFAEKIAKDLLARSLTFEVFPRIRGEGNQTLRVAGEYSCPECHRPHGEWKTGGGIPHDPNILSNGRTVIVVDDF